MGLGGPLTSLIFTRSGGALDCSIRVKFAEGEEAAFLVARACARCGRRAIFPRTAGPAPASDRGRQVAWRSGDGGFSMPVGDLLTLVQYDLPLKVVLLNNSAHARAER
ncbi:thiamine pyrophosphate-dependent enzyme [Streptomyces roseus]|uniref:thiamine pyrophosphate-dependent enzyme n=1 Tax=Streptomyces roseus TaxID=66430 RepID=UPI0038309C76